MLQNKEEFQNLRPVYHCGPDPQSGLRVAGMPDYGSIPLDICVALFPRVHQVEIPLADDSVKCYNYYRRSREYEIIGKK